jgi:GntR family transcriptional regulator
MGDLEISRKVVDYDLSKYLNLPEGEEILQVSRVILAEGKPVAFLIDNLPVDVLSEAEVKEHFTGSVLDLLIKHENIPLTSSLCNISATGASPEIARALEIDPQEPLLVFSSELYSSVGRMIDSSFSYFIPGYFHFHIVRRVGDQL